MRNLKDLDLVSVIIPYYKSKKLIKKSVNSVLNQTYKNLEVIIIYDENTKKNLNFIKQICKTDNRIKLLINKKNIGAGYSRNNGIKHAKGKYIAFIDSDDTWTRNKLLLQINFMKKNNYLATHTSYKIIDDKQNYISIRHAKNLNYKKLLKSCDIGLSTVVITKKLIKNFKTPFPKIKTKEDFVLWLRITKKGIKFYSIKKILTSWTNNPDSLSKSLKQKISDAFRVYFYYQKFNFIKSIYFIFILSLNFLIKNKK